MEIAMRNEAGHCSTISKKLEQSRRCETVGEECFDPQ